MNESRKVSIQGPPPPPEEPGENLPTSEQLEAEAQYWTEEHARRLQEEENHQEELEAAEEEAALQKGLPHFYVVELQETSPSRGSRTPPRTRITTYSLRAASWSEAEALVLSRHDNLATDLPSTSPHVLRYDIIAAASPEKGSFTERSHSPRVTHLYAEDTETDGEARKISGSYVLDPEHAYTIFGKQLYSWVDPEQPLSRYPESHPDRDAIRLCLENRWGDAFRQTGRVLRFKQVDTPAIDFSEIEVLAEESFLQTPSRNLTHEERNAVLEDTVFFGEGSYSIDELLPLDDASLLRCWRNAYSDYVAGIYDSITEA